MRCYSFSRVVCRSLQVIVTVACVHAMGHGQPVSLVQNYSFEEIDSCNIALSDLASGWRLAAEDGTPDLFNRCAIDPIFGVPVPFGGCDTLEPKEGNGYAGLIVYGEFVREYLQTPLVRPLTAGETVFVRFSAAPTDLCFPSLRRFTDAVGIALSDTMVLESLEATGESVLSNIPVVENRGSVLDALEVWTELKGCYEASGSEQYVILGNFVPDSETVLEAPAPWGVVQNYFFIDEVIVSPFDPLPDTTYLCNGIATLDATFFGEEIVWNTNDSTAVIQVSTPGAYTANLILPDCLLSDAVIVLPEPEESASITTELPCNGDSITLQASIEGSYVWSTGEESRSITVSRIGSYEVQIDYGCTVRSETFRVLPQDCNCNVYVGNVFTPNDDGINDILRSNIVCEQGYEFVSFTVFDRWGSLVFQSDQEASGWDGRVIDELVEPGSYVWKVEYRTLVNGQLEGISEIGNVTVVR